MGVVDTEKALRTSREHNLDLVQVTDKVDPPVCKIMDYGKYLYQQEKKEKNPKKTSGLKSIRIGFKTSPHDLETKVKAAERFLKKGNKVKIEMKLRGREKALSNIARQNLNNFVKDIGDKIPIKIERQIKRASNGLTIIIIKE